MDRLKFPVIFLALVALLATLSPADARHRHRHLQRDRAAQLYLHNYGPGLQPGTIAYYDGPARHCAQGAAAYRGQDRRRHPCY
ncbi:MAG: hypothetical protein FWD68_15465 [Alphaproteobacteria bacterium]|nr:hypothetical protein [Alphaproteobacteria bacterium]